MKKSFMREKVIHCGKDYLSPEIFPYTGTQQQAVKGKRGKKKKVSEPKQKNLNDKRAKRYFIQLANANFGEGDLAVHLTYAPEFLPDSYEEAIKIVINFLRRVAYLRKKRGLPPLKYLLITQMGRNGKRIHHHILMNGGLDRDEVESLWWGTTIPPCHPGFYGRLIFSSGHSSEIPLSAAAVPSECTGPCLHHGGR